jgi:peptidyl-prolyl cis-trans isomerase C
MKRVSLLLCLGVLFFGLVFGCAKKEVKTVAKVGDRKITVDDLENEYKQESRLIIQGRPELDRRRDALNKLIRDQVVVIGAYKEGLDKEVENDTTIQKQKDQILLNELGKKEIVDKSKVTEPEIKSQYDKMKEEIHAYHILVETKEQADSIYQKLKEGADFAQMARENSIDPSAKTNGGDLGFFGWGRMIPEFQEVAFKLKDGEISRPVKTMYGWHIIKLVERREAKQPPYEEAKDRIRAQLEREKNQKRVTEYFEELKKKVNFQLNEKAMDLLMSKKTETPPDTSGLQRREYQFDPNNFTDDEKNMSLFTYKGGQTTVGAFIDQFNSMPPMYRPRLDDKEQLGKLAFQSIIPEIALKEARSQNLEKTKDFKENWQRFLEQKMAEKMKSEVILKDAVVTDEDIQSYYDRHPERYEKPAEVHIKEILVKTEPEASDILKQLKKKADFDKLAQEKTIRTAVKTQGGDLGSFSRSRYPELFDAALTMKAGELKGPIKIMDRQFGESYAVIKLIEKKEAYKSPLDEVKTQVASQAKSEKNNQVLNQWIEDQKAKLPIEINEEVLKSTVKEEVKPEEKTEGKG